MREFRFVQRLQTVFHYLVNLKKCFPITRNLSSYISTLGKFLHISTRRHITSVQSGITENNEIKYGTKWINHCVFLQWTSAAMKMKVQFYAAMEVSGTHQRMHTQTHQIPVRKYILLIMLLQSSHSFFSPSSPSNWYQSR